MTSERLEDYEEELKALLDEMQNAISYNIPTKYGEDRRRTVISMEKKVHEAQQLIDDIQREARSSPAPFHQDISRRVVQYRAHLASMKRQLGTGALREELFSREDEDTSDPRQTERELLLKKTDTLHRASQSLHRARNISTETDEIAVGVMEELGEQKQSLLRTRNKVHGIDMEMDRTKKLLRTIVCKGMENRILLVLVIIIELLILAGVTYWKFFS